MESAEERKDIRHGNNSIYRFFLLSYIFILLLALSSGLVYGIKIQAQVRKETQLSQQVLLSSLCSDIETNLDYVQNLCDDLAFNQDLILYVRHPELFAPQTVMGQLSPDGAMADYVLDLFLYMTDSDEIITSSIRMKADRFFNIIYQLNGLSLQQLQTDYLSDYHFRAYLPTLSLYLYGTQSQSLVLPYIQSIPISSKNSPLAQLVVFLDVEKMFARAQAVHIGTDLPVYILTDDNQLIYASTDAPELDPALLDEPGTELHLPGAVATRFTSGETGWQYLVATPASAYYKDSLTTWLFLVAVFLVYLAVGLIVVRRLARRSYRPVKDISDLILQAAPAAFPQPAEQNEYDMIKRTLLGQMRTHREMHSLLEAQQPVVLRDQLHRLILGQVQDVAAARKALQGLGVTFPREEFVCALAEIDTDSPFFLDSETPQEENLPLARLVVQNVGCELLESAFSCLQLDLSGQQLLFILYPRQDGAMGLPEDAVRILGRLSQFAMEHFALELHLGVGLAGRGLENLPLCFDEARKAMDASRYQAGCTPMLFSEQADGEADYYFPGESEQQLLELLRSSNSKGAHELLSRIFSVNFEQKKISALAARGLLYQLASLLQRVANANALAQGKPADFSQQTVERIVNSSSVEHAYTRLSRLIDQAAAFRSQQPVSRTEMLADRIAQFIDSHIENEWLDLNSLSAQFNVTPQYISNIFKKYRSENVKDYIAKRKLAYAKRLLADTSLPVREIAAKLGYANEISVIRLFRKYEGVTPGDYRARHSGGSA